MARCDDRVNGKSPLPTFIFGCDGRFRGQFCEILLDQLIFVGAVEREGRNDNFEHFAGFGLHFVAPGHDSGASRQMNTTGIAERFPRLQNGLLSNHAFAMDLLDAA